MKNKGKGYIAIMIGFFAPVILAMFYLMVHNFKTPFDRNALEQCVKDAALDTARKYIQGRTVAVQQDYLNRIAAVSFNNSMKNIKGITTNILPVNKKKLSYGLSETYYWEYDLDTFTANGKSLSDISEAEYYERTLNRCKFLTEAQNPSHHYPFSSSVIDPDADTIEQAYTPNTELGADGYLLTRDDNGTFNAREIVYKYSGENTNNLTVKSVSDDTLEVGVDITLDGKKYQKSYKAKAPELNADIVLGIPVNTAASTTDNNSYGTAVWANNTYLNTPLWQIKEECRDFVKRFLSCRKCAIGLIPYWGNVVVPIGSSVTTVSHGTYKYSDYAAVNPCIPVAESYKFVTPISGGSGLALNTSDPTANDSNIGKATCLQQFMYRSDLEQYLTKYMKDGKTDQTNIENLLYGEVNSNTSFMFTGLDMIYSGAANIFAGYSRGHMATYPTPYPMYGLTQDPMTIYRYLALFAPFVDQYKRSSFAYLPIMFGMSMLSNGFQNHLTATQAANFATDHSTRKKALVLICNQADLWFPRELTYFGFVNDASYIPMVDGDRIDYEKGTVEDASNGYYRSKIYTSDDVVYETGNYDTTSFEKGEFFNDYDKKVALKCNYPKGAIDGTYAVVEPKPGNTKMVVWSNVGAVLTIFGDIGEHGSIKNLTVAANDSSVYYDCVKDGNNYKCRLINADGGSSTSWNGEFKVTVTKTDESPVILKTELQECEYMSVHQKGDMGYVVSGVSQYGSSSYAGTAQYSTSLCFRQDDKYVYICDSERTSGEKTYTLYVQIKRITKDTDITQHETLGYFKNKLSKETESQEWTDINSTEITGAAYNVEIRPRIDQSLMEVSNTTHATISTECPADKVTELPVNYVWDYKLNDVTYSTSSSTAYAAYMGIQFSDSSSSSFSGYTRGGKPNGIWKIEAKWNHSTYSLKPKTDHSETNVSPTTGYYTASVDGDKATNTSITGIKTLEVVKRHPSTAEVCDYVCTKWKCDKIVTDQVICFRSQKDCPVSYCWPVGNEYCYQTYKEDCTSSRCIEQEWQCAEKETTGGIIKNTNWNINMGNSDCLILKATYYDETYQYPVLCDIYTSGCTVEECSSLSEAQTYIDSQALVRSDNNHYVLVNNNNTKEAYFAVIKSEAYPKYGLKWPLAYANRHVIGKEGSYTFIGSEGQTQGLKKYPYYIYGTGIKVTAYSRGNGWRYNVYDDKRAKITVKNRVDDVKLYLSYKAVKKDSEYYFNHYILSTVSIPSGYTQDTAQAQFCENYIKTHTTGKERSLTKLSQPLTFSGAYSKSWNLNYGYNVIYIPRDQIAANSNDNDSATINFTLDKARVIYIEWSNHLNGIEGCYPRAGEDDLKTKDLRLGTSADSSADYGVWYEKLNRSKNARARWWNVSAYGGSNSGYSTGHDTLQTGTENCGYGSPTDDDPNIIYIENVREKRSRQYNFIKKTAPNDYGYPYCDGDLTLIVTNPRRVQNVFSWMYDTNRTTHSWEYNYLSCVGRYSTMWDRFDDYQLKSGTEQTFFYFNTQDIKDYVARLELGEATIDVNRILMAAGYQTCTAADTGSGMMNFSSTHLMRNTVTPKMVAAFNSKFGDNGRIYVIHYRYTPGSHGGWSANLGGVYKNYTAADQAELRVVLWKIFQDIKQWAGYQDAKIVD